MQARKTSFRFPRTACALALWSAYQASAFALEPDEVFAAVAKSVMLVKTYKRDDTLLSTGSAVTVAPGKLLTNCHVLAKAHRFEIRQENVTYAATLEHIDVDRDMCQITAKNFHAPPVKIADSDRLKVGQKVYAVGNPRGLELTLSDGLISAVRKADNDSLLLIQTSAPISMGSSGGGLFDSNGRLVGITTLSKMDGQNLNFAIPINWLR
jgi:serine protease Do